MTVQIRITPDYDQFHKYTNCANKEIIGLIKSSSTQF